MRIGVRVTVDEISAAAVTEGEQFTFARRTTDGDLNRAVVDVLSQLQRDGGGSVTSVVFDVSAVLCTAVHDSVTSVLIEPRLPIEPRRHLWLTESLRVTPAHVRGGHNALGQELVPLDEDALRALAGGFAAGTHLVVSAAGSPVNAAHERRAVEILRSVAPFASITQSNMFSSDNLLVREYTAVLNALLLSSAERLAESLADAVVQAVGRGARAYVATNEGGCTPLTRLPITPVHAIRADVAGEMLGGAAIAGRPDGRVIVARPGAVRVGEFIDGLPSVLSRTSLPDGTSLASSFAHVVPLTDLLLLGSAEPPVTVLVTGAEHELEPFGLAPAVVTDADLVALGAAVAPMSYWHNRLARVLGPADIDRALRDGEGIARANLVAAGADPAAVRIAESRVLASAYGEAQFVRVRVRGVAELPGPGWVGEPAPRTANEPTHERRAA